MSVTQQSPRSGALPGGLAVDPAGVAWFLVAVVAGLPLFWIGFTGLATAWARPEYSHGPVIPLPLLLHLPARDALRAAGRPDR